jgi:hypothetical protein
MWKAVRLQAGRTRFDSGCPTSDHPTSEEDAMARKRDKQAVYRATASFFYGDNEKVTAGENVHGDHEVLDKYPEYFEVVSPSARFQAPEVEQATAAPGEKRGE